MGFRVGNLSVGMALDTSGLATGVQRAEAMMGRLKKQTGEGSFFGGLGKVLMGGGAVAGVTLLGNVVGDFADKVGELREALRSGALTRLGAVRMALERAPLVGSFIHAGGRIHEAITGDEARFQRGEDIDAQLAQRRQAVRELEGRATVLGQFGPARRLAEIENAAKMRAAGNADTLTLISQAQREYQEEVADRKRIAQWAGVPLDAIPMRDQERAAKARLTEARSLEQRQRAASETVRKAELTDLATELWQQTRMGGAGQMDLGRMVTASGAVSGPPLTPEMKRAVEVLEQLLRDGIKIRTP